jgi:hypothetical protein
MIFAQKIVADLIELGTVLNVAEMLVAQIVVAKNH